MMALSGVRSSWDMFARNCDLCWLATSSSRPFSSSSWNRRAFWIASADWLAKVWSSSTDARRERAGRLAADHQAAERRGPRAAAARPAAARKPAASQRARDAARRSRPRPAMSGDLDRRRVAAPPDRRRPRPSAERCALGRPLPASAATRRSRAGANSPLGLVELVDRAAVGPESSDGVRDDGRRAPRWRSSDGADRLADLAERLQLARLRSLQLLEQPRVLDGDDRLVGERLQQRDLRSVNGRDLHAARGRSCRAARPRAAAARPAMRTVGPIAAQRPELGNSRVAPRMSRMWIGPPLERSPAPESTRRPAASGMPRRCDAPVAAPDRRTWPPRAKPSPSTR